MVLGILLAAPFIIAACPILAGACVGLFVCFVVIPVAARYIASFFE